MEKDRSLEQENVENSFIKLLKAGADTPESGKECSADEQNISSLLTLFAELSHGIKGSLEKMRSLVHLSREKFSNQEYGEFFCRTISNDIAKTDALLSCFTNYLRINSPIPRANTVHVILEEVSKKYEKLLEEKKVTKFKKQYQENIPETSLHDEQLRFIINSILQYAIPSIPPQGSIGFMTRSLEAQEVQNGGKSPQQKEGKYVEILIGFTCYKNGGEPLDTILESPPSPQNEKDDFILRLVDEIIKVNRGTMGIRVDSEKPLTLISLKLPIERRRRVQYQSTTA